MTRLASEKQRFGRKLILLQVPAFECIDVSKELNKPKNNETNSKDRRKVSEPNVSFYEFRAVLPVEVERDRGNQKDLKSGTQRNYEAERNSCESVGPNSHL